MHVPTWGLIRENGNTLMATRGAKLGLMQQKMEQFLKTHKISVSTKFERDCMNTFSDDGQKPPFTPNFIILFWPRDGHDLAIMAPKQTSFEHSPNKCRHQVWIVLCEYLFG